MVSAQKVLKNPPDLEGLNADQIAAMMLGTVAMKTNAPLGVLSEIDDAIDAWLSQNHGKIAFENEREIPHLLAEPPTCKHVPFSQKTFGQRYFFLCELYTKLSALCLTNRCQISEISNASTTQPPRTDSAYTYLPRLVDAHHKALDDNTQNALSKVAGNLPAKVTLNSEKYNRAITTAVNGADLNKKQVALLQAAGNQCRSEPEIFGHSQESKDLCAFIIEISNRLNSGLNQLKQ